MVPDFSCWELREDIMIGGLAMKPLSPQLPSSVVHVLKRCCMISNTSSVSDAMIIETVES